jgi:DNA-binding ferritin-like protein
MTLRNLYKKSHWQVAGPTFYQLHLLFDKHYREQVEIVDEIAERIQLLGGVSLAMAADVAETTRIELLRAAGRKCLFRFPGSWTRIRSSLATAGSYRAALPK